MEGNQDKGESPISNAEMETIVNNLQEHLNSHDNQITCERVRMVEFAYAYFGDLKDDVLKEIPQGGFGIFVNAWSLCAFFNMDYTSEFSFLERGKKVRGVHFKSSGEASVASTFDHKYPTFLVGHSNRDMAVGTLLPKL